MTATPGQSPKAAILSDKQLGDVLLLEPMTRLLADQTGSPCALLVKEGFRPLIDLMPFACWGPDWKTPFEVIWTTSWGSRSVRRNIGLKAAKKILLINMPEHCRWWYRLLVDEIRLEPICREYWAHYFWRVAGGDPQAFAGPHLQPPPDSWRHPQLPEGRPYVLINPTAATTDKFWDAHHWRRLRREHRLPSDLLWVMTGGMSEVETTHCREIAADLDQAWIDLSGQTTLPQYLHALSRAAMVIAVDGSASHLAQAFGVPVITLFGPSYFTRWHLPTPRHRAVYPGLGSDYSPAPLAMTDLASEAVIEASAELWTQLRPAF
jgi:ADP-heptose:LPS heptosyltransferase